MYDKVNLIRSACRCIKEKDHNTYSIVGHIVLSLETINCPRVTGHLTDNQLLLKGLDAFGR